MVRSRKNKQVRPPMLIALLELDLTVAFAFAAALSIGITAAVTVAFDL